MPQKTSKKSTAQVPYWLTQSLQTIRYIDWNTEQYPDSTSYTAADCTPVWDELATLLDEAITEQVQALVLDCSQLSGWTLPSIGTHAAASPDYTVPSSAHRALSVWKNAPCLTIARINGTLQGTGLAFAAAARHRLTPSIDYVVLSFPEIAAGSQPGWGILQATWPIMMRWRNMHAMLQGLALQGPDEMPGLENWIHPLPAPCHEHATVHNMLQVNKNGLYGQLSDYSRMYPRLKSLLQRVKSHSQRLRLSAYYALYRTGYMRHTSSPMKQQQRQLWHTALGIASTTAHTPDAPAIYVATGYQACRQHASTLRSTAVHQSPLHIHIVGASTAGIALVHRFMQREKPYRITWEDPDLNRLAKGYRWIRERHPKRFVPTLIPDTLANGARHADWICDMLPDCLPTQWEQKQQWWSKQRSHIRSDAIRSALVYWKTQASAIQSFSEQTGAQCITWYTNIDSCLQAAQAHCSPLFPPALWAILHQQADPASLLAWATPIASTPDPLSQNLELALLSAYWEEAYRLYRDGVQPAIIDNAAQKIGASIGPLRYIQATNAFPGLRQHAHPQSSGLLADDLPAVFYPESLHTAWLTAQPTTNDIPEDVCLRLQGALLRSALLLQQRKGLSLSPDVLHDVFLCQIGAWERGRAGPVSQIMAQEPTAWHAFFARLAQRHGPRFAWPELDSETR